MTRIKICGLTNLEDALFAAECGVDMLGFIFYEPSPRYVTPDTAAEIIHQIKQAGYPARPVGVFVNAFMETVRHIIEQCQLTAVQLHGEESPAFVQRFGGQAYKAIRPQTLDEALILAKRYIDNERAIAPQKEPLPPSTLPDLLLDAYHPTLYGGTGHVTDWRMAEQIAKQYTLMLAGSLTPENVAEAIIQVQPWGVDVSSGVEKTKGKKDHAKVRALVEAVRASVYRK